MARVGLGLLDMFAVLRHLLAIFILPFSVAVIIPVWLLTSFVANDTRWTGSTSVVWLARGFGTLLFIAGFVLFVWCVSLFARVGQGTLAPWDPTRSLVAVGPYRFVRNPMISGVVLVLLSEALVFGSIIVAIWACLFLAVNQIYFVFYEEPGLEKRFGDNYRTYKMNVPRWIPRFNRSGVSGSIPTQ